MRLWICGVALAVACDAGPEQVFTVRPGKDDGPVPPDVQPVLVASAWWDGFERTGWALTKQPGDTPVSVDVVGYDNGLLFRPTVRLVEGGTFSVGGTTFRVDPQAVGLKPEGPWPSEVTRAETDLLVLKLWLEATPAPPWFEVQVRVSADCMLELIAVDGYVEAEATACGLDLFPDTVTVAQRPVDWSGESVVLSEPRVVLLDAVE